MHRDIIGDIHGHAGAWATASKKGRGVVVTIKPSLSVTILITTTGYPFSSTGINSLTFLAFPRRSGR
jgi:hypothetical protein